MSNLERKDNLKQIVAGVAPTFKQLAKIHGAVHFEREASFAIQLLQDNEYLAKIAMGNPESLKRAVINVAAVGLSLSPVSKHAYLVPRDGKVCLDISYKGLVQLACDIGSIEWAKAEVVHEKDTFIYMGMGREPEHKFFPFDKDRGAIVGAYCIAKLMGGEYMTEMMSLEEVYAIRDRSSAWKAWVEKKKKNPWVTDEVEMIKKTVVKRGSKSWPMVDRSNRLDVAVDATNEADEIILDVEPIVENNERGGQISAIKERLVELEKTEKSFIEYCARATRRKIKVLEDLTDIELTQAEAFINQLKKPEKKDEAS